MTLYKMDFDMFSNIIYNGFVNHNIIALTFPGNNGGGVLSNIELINNENKSNRKMWVSLIGIVSDLCSYNE